MWTQNSRSGEGGPPEQRHSLYRTKKILPCGEGPGGEVGAGDPCACLLCEVSGPGTNLRKDEWKQSLALLVKEKNGRNRLKTSDNPRPELKTRTIVTVGTYEGGAGTGGELERPGVARAAR